MKKLASYLKRYTKESILAPLFKLLEVVFDLMVPLVVARMINIGVAGNDRGYMVRCFLILILMALLGLAASITAQFFAAKASTGFAADLRQAVFDHIQGFSFTELDTLGADTMITRLTDDINQVQTGVNMGLRLLLRSPFVVFGAMIMVFTIDVSCAWVFAVVIPVLFVAVFAIMLSSLPLYRKAQSALDRVTCLTRENLTGVRVIRAFCREDHSVREFDESSQALTRLNEFVGKISALLNPLTYVLINLAAVVLIDRAALRVNIGSIAQGDVVALNNYMLQITVELIKLASLIITLTKSMACAGRVASVLEQPTSMTYPEKGAQPRENADEAVRFDHVNFTYRNAGAPSLTDISFCAKKGQTVGIIGGTGSGKSTLISLIPRFYDAASGTVCLDGCNVKEYTQEALCRKIAVVQQRSVLFQGTIRDNLRWGNENASDEELWQALEVAQAREIVEGKEGQLDFRLEQGGRNLSGGQKQRLSIARALVKKPEILILDDSSSALDFATDAALRSAIHGLGGGVTTFLVSQRIACIRQADQILVLDNGSLAGVGTHETLLERCGLYQEIFDSQFPGEREKKEGNV